MGNRIAVYTAIFGDKDNPPELLNKNQAALSEIDFYCVTDNTNLKTDDYDIQICSQKFTDITKNARYIKVNGFKGIENYDIAIWHDSSVMLYVDKIQELASLVEDHPLSTFHHVRYCAYLEAIACIDQKKDSGPRIAAQMFRYFKEGFPANYGLHETTITVFNCSKYLNSDLHKTWWNEIEMRSRRDQLSLAYARWKTQTEIGLLDHWSVSGAKNSYSKHVGHKHDRYDHQNPLLFINFSPIRWISKKLIFEMRRRR